MYILLDCLNQTTKLSLRLAVTSVQYSTYPDVTVAEKHFMTRLGKLLHEHFIEDLSEDTVGGHVELSDHY